MVNHDKPKIYGFEANTFNNINYYTWNESKQSRQFVILNYKDFNEAALKTKAGVIYNNTYYKKGYPSLVNKEYDGKKKGIGKTLHIVENTFKELGYFFQWKILNTKEHNVPQNRERIYIVGFKKEVHFKKFNFRLSSQLHINLKDILDDKIDDKYIIDIDNFYDLIKVDSGLIKVKQAVKKGFILAEEGDSINFSVPSSLTRRGRVGKGIAQTLDCACNQLVVIKKEGKLCFKRLSPRECFKLQGFSNDFKFNVSDRQAYKQAGNSMSANITSFLLDDICEILRISRT